jgi:dTDP-4-amino-4,6-dideoxygalactose transaminase
MNKHHLRELAICGGAPAFSEDLCVGRPNIGDRTTLLKRINQMLDARWLSNDGPLVEEFERRVAEYVGVRHCVAMCNGTIALEITLRALGLSGEVIVPSFTFIATAHALQWQQMTPVFADIDPVHHLIDPQRIEELITSRTRAIIGVHLWGDSCDVEQIATIAERHHLKVIFDAAHAFGCTHKGKMIGGFGDAEVFSFHATKFFNTFEGGAVTTNDAELARKLRLMRNFGFSDYDEVTECGTNGKMIEVAAAMGLTSLESLTLFIDTNRRNYELYQRELDGITGIRLLTFDSHEKSNYQYVVLELDEDVAGISRDQLLQILWAERVIARRYFYPGCHRMEPYRTLYPESGQHLPVTERVVKQVLVLPTGTAISADDIRAISAIIRLSVANGPELSSHLKQGQAQAKASTSLR